MASSPNRLTELQRAVLEEFFAREQGFFLSGGAALAGFHLGHRSTIDLDLFTSDRDAFARGGGVLRDVADALQGTVVVRQDSVAFQRFLVERPGEGLIVDLVYDTVVQAVPEKERHGAIVVDPSQEILANKLTTLVSRQEERDLVDVYCLEKAGLDLESALDAALAKDGGCTPATLAWLLSSFPLPPQALLPEGASVDELSNWRDDLVTRLRRLALPTMTAE